MGKILRSILGNEDSQSVEEQFEVIVSDLTDHEDKLFVWQFPNRSEEELERLYEEVLEDIVVYGMKSQHVFVSGTVEIEELISEEEHIILARDKVFDKLSEEEE